MKNALVLLAGGDGKRLGSSKPKQFIIIDNTTLIEYLLENLNPEIFDIIIIVTKNNYKKKYLYNLKKKFFYHNIKYTKSGKTRQISTLNSLLFLKKFKIKNVLIHDSARPLASNFLFKKIIKKLEKNISCIPFYTSNDKILINKKENIKNNEIKLIQTPQGFKFNEIYNAHKKFIDFNAKDDSILIEKNCHTNTFIKGEFTNIKVTKKEDLEIFRKLKIRNFRSGIGYDIHKIDFLSQNKLKLCGIKINHPPLIGHSDADVGFHAICDSILGSLSMRDIGYYFNNNNKKWKNANSEIFLKFCYNKLIENKYKIINLDINFICETPNINNLSNKMKINLSKLLKISSKNISIKATTNEKIGLIGRGEAIAAQSIIQISNA